MAVGVRRSSSPSGDAAPRHLDRPQRDLASGGQPHVGTNFMAVGARSTTPPPGTTVVTIEPGAVVRFRTGAGLIVGDIGPAALRITSGNQVIMEADTLPSQRGSWMGLYFEGVGPSDG